MNKQEQMIYDKLCEYATDIMACEYWDTEAVKTLENGLWEFLHDHASSDDDIAEFIEQRMSETNEFKYVFTRAFLLFLDETYNMPSDFRSRMMSHRYDLLNV